MQPRFSRNLGGLIQIRDERGDALGRIAFDTYVNGQANGATPWVVYAGVSANPVDVGRFAHLADARAFACEYFTRDDDYFTTEEL